MKKFLKSPWTISFATALFSFLLSIAYDLLKGKQILSTIKSIFSAVINGISAFLNIELKVWWVLVGIIAIVATLLCIGYIMSRNSAPRMNPEFMSYTEDYFGSWKWSWIWSFDSLKKKWHAQDIVAHCPKCGTPMLHDDFNDFFHCPRCGFDSEYGDGHKKIYEVDALIVDNVNRRKKGKET